MIETEWKGMFEISNTKQSKGLYDMIAFTKKRISETLKSLLSHTKLHISKSLGAYHIVKSYSSTRSIPYVPPGVLNVRLVYVTRL